MEQTTATWSLVRSLLPFLHAFKLLTFVCIFSGCCEALRSHSWRYHGVTHRALHTLLCILAVRSLAQGHKQGLVLVRHHSFLDILLNGLRTGTSHKFSRVGQWALFNHCWAIDQIDLIWMLSRCDPIICYDKVLVACGSDCWLWSHCTILSTSTLLYVPGADSQCKILIRTQVLTVNLLWCCLPQDSKFLVRS